MPTGRRVAQASRLRVPEASRPAMRSALAAGCCQNPQAGRLCYTKKARDCSRASVNQQTGLLLHSLIDLVGARHFEAGRRGRHSRNGVAVGERLAARRANHRVLQIRQDVRRRDRRRIALFRIEGPLLDGAINLSQVADTGVHLRRRAGLDEVGDRDRSQKADNGHYDHDLHQRKAPLAGCSVFHHFVFLLLRREPSNRRLLLVQYAFTYCPLLTADKKVTDGPAKAMVNAAPRRPFLTRCTGRIRPEETASVSNLDWPYLLWTWRWTSESGTRCPKAEGRRAKRRVRRPKGNRRAEAESSQGRTTARNEGKPSVWPCKPTRNKGNSCGAGFPGIRRTGESTRAVPWPRDPR